MYWIVRKKFYCVLSSSLLICILFGIFHYLFYLLEFLKLPFLELFFPQVSQQIVNNVGLLKQLVRCCYYTLIRILTKKYGWTAQIIWVNEIENRKDTHQISKHYTFNPPLSNNSLPVIKPSNSFYPYFLRMYLYTKERASAAGSNTRFLFSSTAEE